jgi:hypothetical protein
MHNFNAAVIAVMLLQFFLDTWCVPDEKEPRNMGILFQRHDRAADNIRRAEIASHRIQRDFHRSGILRISGDECKIKNRTWWRPACREDPARIFCTGL